MDKRNENNAGSDGSKGENHVNRGSARPNAVGMMRVMVCQMTNDERDGGDDTNDSQSHHEVQSTRGTPLLLVTRSTRTQVCRQGKNLCDGNPSASDLNGSRGSEGSRVEAKS